MAITAVITAARKTSPKLAEELKECSTPTEREVLTYFRGYVPRPDSLGSKLGEPMPVPTLTEWAAGTGFGNILPTPYITPTYLAALLGRRPSTVLRAALTLVEQGTLPPNLFPGRDGAHEYAPMVLDESAAPVNREHVTPGEGMDADALESACPYQGYMCCHVGDDGEPATVFHSALHKNPGSSTFGGMCMFADYAPQCGAPATTMGATGDVEARKLRLHVPTRNGLRRHTLTHPQFHAYYTNVPERDCPWCLHYTDSAEYPWSDLNPTNIARLQAWKAEQDSPRGEAPGKTGKLSFLEKLAVIADTIHKEW